MSFSLEKWEFCVSQTWSWNLRTSFKSMLRAVSQEIQLSSAKDTPNQETTQLTTFSRELGPWTHQHREEMSKEKH